MDADLDDQILPAALGIECGHRRPHAQTRHDRMFRPDEGRHHGVADRLHDRALFRGDDFEQRMKMRPHQIEGGEIADPLIERGGALQVREQERQRSDLEALIDVEIVRLEDVAKTWMPGTRPGMTENGLAANSVEVLFAMFAGLLGAIR